MRRSFPRENIWARYKLHAALPKGDGPPPPDAPQSLNGSKQMQYVDHVETSMPISIRGDSTLMDIPPEQYVDQTFAINATIPLGKDVHAWTSVNPGKYRFRPHAELDAYGRRTVERLRKGRRNAPFMDSYLTRMAGHKPKAAPTPAVVMERAVQHFHQRGRYVAPVDVERDVGRVTGPAPRPTESTPTLMPTTYNTEDWYEMEVAKVRTKRFNYQNDEGDLKSEITYKLILGTLWEHHCDHLAEDVSAFLRDVGRQIVEEKLAGVRATLASYEAAGAVDQEMREAFNLGTHVEYDDEEIVQFAAENLRQLERDCTAVLGRMRSTSTEFSNLGQEGVAWPHVKELEPWRKMIEYFGRHSEATYKKFAGSIVKYEFRRFFRVVELRMPFQSSEFEKRMYDIRHWLHRHATVEFQTIYRKNVIHDASRFPVEHEAVNRPTHEDFAMYSFALDWNQGAVDRVRSLNARESDTLGKLAAALGCPATVLADANPHLASGVTDPIPKGTVVNVPRGVAGAPMATPGQAQVVQRDASWKTWEDAAAALGVSLEALQAANAERSPVGDAAAKDGALVSDIETLRLPVASTPWYAEPFATQERVLGGDTFEAIARRLGTTVDDLRAVNPEVATPADLLKTALVKVPQTATRKRRLFDAQRRSPDEAREQFAALVGEQSSRQLPPQLPEEPENAKAFPDEFVASHESQPRQPETIPGTSSWLEYTATYLDPKLSLRTELPGSYQTNPAWPAQPIPGTEQQTPFEEDSTWLFNKNVVQQFPVINPKQVTQDLPNVNHETFPTSVQREAP